MKEISLAMTTGPATASAKVLPFRRPARHSPPQLQPGNAVYQDDFDQQPGQSLLWGAIAEARLVTHYQPQYDLAQGNTVGMEALVRIRGEDGQLHFPDQFIREAETSGLIMPLGRTVINHACQDLATWRSCGFNVARVSINLSAHQLNADQELLAYIERTVLSHGLAFSDLEFELTERQALSTGSQAMATLRLLSSMGARLAIDDFGTGYSSVAYLSELPIDTVKLDRYMVDRTSADATTRRVVCHLLKMAQDLGLTTVGEGVETQAQNDFLAEQGCNLGQGYLVSKPKSASEISAWLGQSPAAAGRSPV